MVNLLPLLKVESSERNVKTRQRRSEGLNRRRRRLKAKRFLDTMLIGENTVLVYLVACGNRVSA
ncbi:hypothetical protein FGIG_10325 [Fasciola gigantica]|uniref:Uncharacterized protein n=1 Tax=Fasciola gigantica TaxID=46835 RepID=A0A504YAJ2_FASGI|nr:hypothetical protein FGIG_10325 [Fasciola gigantica]